MEYEGDATRVVVFLTWLVRGRAGQPRGTTGSVLGSLKDLGQSMAELKYVLTAAVPMITALDKVVEMTRGGVWFAWQHTRSDGRIGCRAVVYFPNGLVSAPDEDFFVTPGTIGRSPMPSPDQPITRSPEDGFQVSKDAAGVTGGSRFAASSGLLPQA